MKTKKIDEIIDEIVPCPKTVASRKEVISYFKEIGIPFSDRVLIKYSKMGIIKSPFYMGNKACFERKYIFKQLKAIFVLKAFGFSLESIKSINDGQRSGKFCLCYFVERMYQSKQWEKVKIKHKKTGFLNVRKSYKQGTAMKKNFKKELEKLNPGQVLLLKQVLLQEPKTPESKQKLKCIEETIKTYK